MLEKESILSLKYKALVYMRNGSWHRAEAEKFKSLVKMCKIFSNNNTDHHKTKIYKEEKHLGTIRKGSYKEQ